MADSKKKHGQVSWGLWVIAVLGILVPVILARLGKVEFGLCCLGLFLFGIAVVIYASWRYFSGPPDIPPPHFRRVRFFNSTRRKVKAATITKNPSEPPSDPPLTPLPVNEIPNVGAVGSYELEVPYEMPFERRVTRLDVTLTLEGLLPDQPEEVGFAFFIEVPGHPGTEAGFIEELEVLIFEDARGCEGKAYIRYGLKCGALVRSAPVFFPAT